MDNFSLKKYLRDQYLQENTSLTENDINLSLTQGEIDTLKLALALLGDSYNMAHEDNEEMAMNYRSILSKMGINENVKGKLFKEEENLQMTYKGDPVHLQISKFGGTPEKPNDTVLFINVGGRGKRRSTGSKSTLERRLKLLDQKVDKILFTDNDNITKAIKSFNKSDFKIK
jgi:hypothetical protein